VASDVKEKPVSYATSVTFLDTAGGSSVTTSVTARLWMLWTEVGGSQAVHRKQEEGTTTFDLNKGGSSASTVEFNRDGSFTELSRSVGLSIQDTNRVVTDTGWLFRSGRYEDLPTDPIEVIGAFVSIPATDLASLMPTPPFSVDSSTTITSLSASYGAGTSGPPPVPGGIDFSATGTTTKTGVVVGFRFTGRIVLAPSDDIAIAHIEAFAVSINNPRIVFISGPSVLSAIEAEILNLLRVFIMHDTLPTIRANVERRINTAIISSVGRQLPGGVLPEGVILSVRAVAIKSDASALDVSACLGAFGGVFTKLPPLGGGAGKSCPLQTLMALGYGLAGLLPQLRETRDTRLLTVPLGRRLTELYYQFGPEISTILRSNRFLSENAAQTVESVTTLISRGAPWPASLRRQSEMLLRDLASHGSSELQAAVKDILEEEVWALGPWPVLPG
jgi:hypothetical protein